MKFSYRVGGDEFELVLEKRADGYVAHIGEHSFEISGIEAVGGELRFALDGVPQRADWAVEQAAGAGLARWIALDGGVYRLEPAGRGARRAGGHGPADGQHVAPMPGQVRDVLVQVGDRVEEGQTLLLLEAMKMELRIQAARAGTVETLAVSAGQQVDKDDVLVVVAAAEDA